MGNLGLNRASQGSGSASAPKLGLEPAPACLMRIEHHQNLLQRLFNLQTPIGAFLGLSRLQDGSFPACSRIHSLDAAGSHSLPASGSIHSLQQDAFIPCCRMHSFPAAGSIHSPVPAGSIPCLQDPFIPCSRIHSPPPAGSIPRPWRIPPDYSMCWANPGTPGRFSSPAGNFPGSGGSRGDVVLYHLRWGNIALVLEAMAKADVGMILQDEQ